MPDISDGIRILRGSTDILVVSPHSPVIAGKYENDVRTGIVAEEIHQQLGCTAIINDRYFKPKGPVKKDAENYFLDLYRVDHSRKVAGYIDAIKQVVDTPGKTLVLWLHGMFTHFSIDRAKEHINLGLFKGQPGDLNGLIAWGQGGDPKSGDKMPSYSAHQNTVEAFRQGLVDDGMNIICTHDRCNNYRGRDGKRFNQFFLQQGYAFDQVESIQLETKEKGFRDSKQNALKTGQLIAKALTRVVEQSKGQSQTKDR